jgi:hypothetical protein
VIYVWFHDYLMFGGGTMRDQEEQAAKEAKREEKRIAEEPARLAREQARRKTDLVREQAIAEDQEARKRKAKNQPPE